MSRPHFFLAFAVLLGLLSSSVAGTTEAKDATFKSAIATCPLTKPNGVFPPEMVQNNGNYGNEALWTNLSMWSDVPGIVAAPNDDHLGSDGSIRELKWAWYRFLPGKLVIEGHRLDAASAPLIASVPDGYGDIGFQVSGLTFPSAGCWQVTGTIGDHALTFIIRVVTPPRPTTSALPAA